MSVYKGNGSVDTVYLGYSDFATTRKPTSYNNSGLSYICSSSSQLTNVQVKYIDALHISFKCSLSDVSNVNVCSYAGVVWSLENYTQTSTSYVTTSWVFAPLLTYGHYYHSNTYAITLNGYLTETLSTICEPTAPNEIYTGLQAKKANKTQFYKEVVDNTNLYLFVKLSLPPKLMSINMVGNPGPMSLDGGGISASGDVYLRGLYDNVGNADLTFSIAIVLMAIASDPLYAGCVSDVYVCNESTLNWTTTSTDFNFSDFVGINALYDVTLTKVIPKIYNAYSVNVNSLYDASSKQDIYTKDLLINYGSETKIINLYELIKTEGYQTIQADTDVFGSKYNKINVISLPAMSSEGGKYVVTLTRNTITSGDYNFNENLILAEFSKPCIPLQPLINQASQFWQSNKERWELSLNLKEFETVWALLANVLGGARTLLQATGAGMYGIVTQALTKDALIKDLSAIGGGGTGGSAVISSMLFEISVIGYSTLALTKLRFYNPISCYEHITHESYNDPKSPLYAGAIDTNNLWIKGYISVSASFLQGKQKEIICKMFAEGISLNYNVGLGYQGA